MRILGRLARCPVAPRSKIFASAEGEAKTSAEKHCSASIRDFSRYCIAVELSIHLLYNPPVLSDSKMRRKVIFFVVVGLLFCSLATLETTEFLKLADDTSNDFSLLNVEANTSSAVVRQSRESQPKAVPAPQPIHSSQPKLHPDVSYSSNAPTDILHVLCVIRT
jgi:hypothetical protein